MIRLLMCAAMVLCLLSGALPAQLMPDSAAYEEQILQEEMMAAYVAYRDSVEGTLTFYADTTLDVGDGLITLDVPEGYRFLYHDDARTVLVDMWGNPPAAANETIGMLFPADKGPADLNGFGIDISFTEDGYISDDDAADMDYDDMLESMQEGVAENNEDRIAQGYETIKLLGWAAPPRYDATHKRLHWAKELHFEGAESNTLNYNILFLGRRGYLTMNVIGEMSDLPQVNATLDEFLGSVTYQEGNRYADFDPDLDEVAAYGIGALIAGKVLMKTGLLATIGLFLAKGWKLIAIALFGGLAGFRRFFGKKEE